MEKLYEGETKFWKLHGGKQSHFWAFMQRFLPSKNSLLMNIKLIKSCNILAKFQQFADRKKLRVPGFNQA